MTIIDYICKMGIDWQDIDDRLEELRNPGFLIQKRRNERIELLFKKSNNSLNLTYLFKYFILVYKYIIKV